MHTFQICSLFARPCEQNAVFLKVKVLKPTLQTSKCLLYEFADRLPSD